MKRAVPRHRWPLILAAALLVLSGIAWGATRSHAPTTAAAKPVATVPTPQPAAPTMATVTSTPAATPAAVQAPTARAGEAGMRIFRDPETGEASPPTAELIRQMQTESRGDLEVDVARLPETKLPDGGGYMINTSGIQDAVVLQIDKNGKRVMRCVTNEKAANRQTPDAAAPAREDR